MFFWLSHRDLNHKTVFKFARGSSGRNGVEQTIANITSAPTGVTWREMSDIPFEPMISTFDAGDVYPIWVWRHVEATTTDNEAWIVKDDPCMFNGAFKIVSGGTGSPGQGPGTDPDGGTGGGGPGEPPPAVVDYRLVFVGDEGCENATEDVIALIQSLDPHGVISVGDHAYESPQCWTTLFQAIKDDISDTSKNLSFFTGAYGNHEYEESGGIGPYKTFFNHTLTYFQLRTENMGITFMDTNIDISSGSTQYNASVTNSTSSVKAVHDASSLDWNLVVMHHPWFVDGSRNEANEFNQIQELHQVFNDNDVDLVITGHNHNWQRTNQLTYNAGDPLHAPTVVDSSSPYTSGAGLIHVVTGTGGHDTSTGLYQLPTQPSFQAYQTRLYNGVWIIDASNNGQTLTCYFMNTDSQIFDSFVYNK